jgi:putative PIG3 family NAD(P)H quinone oxidoreductase
MKAIVASQPGGPEVLELVERPDTEPDADELLLRVRAAGVNRADVLQRQGRYPPPEGGGDVLGLETAGEVAAVGAEVTGWSVGDQVCALLPGGGYAELATVPASVALPWPAALGPVEAGCAYEVYATAYDNLLHRGQLDRGETALVHGGASGVGTAAIQLAKRAGARVLVTVGAQEKADTCRRLGADAAIIHREEDFVERARELTDGPGVDVVLDIVGADYLERNLRALAADGRLVIIGLMGGARAEIDLARLLTRRLSVAASTLRARPVEQKAALAERLRTDVWPGFDEGSLQPVVDSVFALEHASDAHRRMEASDHVGNIVLTVP